jgi:acylphosphatase
MEVEGTRYRIERFLEDLQKGPGAAKVYKADVQWKTDKNEFRDFRSHL